MKIDKILNEQFTTPKNIVLTLKRTCILLLLFLLQSCTSGVEVAANLGKKYLLPKEKGITVAKPLYKIGNKYNVKGKFYFPKKD